VSLFLRYTLLRFGLLVLVLAALALVGVRGILLPALAVLISLPLSYVLLARQRNAFAAEVERRVHERQERRADLRAEMAGDPVATADPADGYADDAYLAAGDLTPEVPEAREAPEDLSEEDLATEELATEDLAAPGLAAEDPAAEDPAVDSADPAEAADGAAARPPASRTTSAG
jgi:Protein of unknown function (DUF4229)